MTATVTLGGKNQPPTELMNCHAAIRLISAERDGSLTAQGRAGLDGHLADCSDCQGLRKDLTKAIDEWRSSTANVKVPDADRAWQDIRREIRAGATSSRAQQPIARRLARWTIPLGAAAALAVALSTVAPSRLIKPASGVISPRQFASADYVEVPNDSSSMVYVDDESGWLVVWAVTDKIPAGG